MLRWLGEQEDPRTIGLFRITLGVLLIADVATLWLHAAYLYGDEGVLPAAEACHEGVVVLSAMCWLPGTFGARNVLGAFLLAALAFTVGLQTRTTKWLTAYLFFSIIVRGFGS